jgi:hypothetical protein
MTACPDQSNSRSFYLIRLAGVNVTRAWCQPNRRVMSRQPKWCQNISTLNSFNNYTFKLLRYVIKFVIDCSFNCRIFFNLTLIFNSRKCFQLNCFYKKSINWSQEMKMRLMIFWYFFPFFVDTFSRKLLTNKILFLSSE